MDSGDFFEKLTVLSLTHHSATRCDSTWIKDFENMRGIKWGIASIPETVPSYQRGSHSDLC